MNRLIQLLADNRQSKARRFEVVAVDGTDEAEVYLYDAIVSDEIEAEWWGGVAAAPFVKALRGITASTIHLRVNSPGGSVFAARAIEQALREHKARVVAHVDGLAASAASFIIMGADEIVMAKGAMVMIHKGWTFAMGNADELRRTVDLLDKLDGTLVDTYADRTKQAPEQIAEWMAAETWFTATEAVEHGFADRLADSAADEDEDEDEAEAAAGWNLSAYLQPPKAHARLPESVQAGELAALTEHRDRQQQRMAALLRTPIR
ncbi:MAG: head maturation protease, ClpP-related [Pseudomonadota bacterium]